MTSSWEKEKFESINPNSNFSNSAASTNLLKFFSRKDVPACGCSKFAEKTSVSCFLCLPCLHSNHHKWTFRYAKPCLLFHLNSLDITFTAIWLHLLHFLISSLFWICLFFTRVFISHGDCDHASFFLDFRWRVLCKRVAFAYNKLVLKFSLL